MKVKKFTCHQCGAPKITPYKNPYIICDFCGNMIDVDYTAGIEVWNKSAEHTNEYQRKKLIFEANSSQYALNKNEEAYRKEQYAYWDFYYKHYPEYLPPSIPKGEKYELFLQACVDITADSVFNPPPPDKANKYNEAYAGLEYYNTENGNFVTYDSFIKMIRAYIEYRDESFKSLYSNPKYAIYHELMPEQFQSKMNLSQIAQIWVPYLQPDDADRFLEEFKLKQEFTDVQEPLYDKMPCEDCKKELKILKGAIKCICEHCRYENVIRKTVNCKNCGVENNLPENWKISIDCNSCGTELRVVQPLFG